MHSYKQTSDKFMSLRFEIKMQPEQLPAKINVLCLILSPPVINDANFLPWSIAVFGKRNIHCARKSADGQAYSWRHLASTQSDQSLRCPHEENLGP